jgi:hypothetical protein
LIWQKDSRINIELLESSALIARANKEDSAVMRQIAIETKKDNASMKTIAILGMFFLPGTFVAVCFSTPSPSIQQTDNEADDLHNANVRC